MRGSQSSADAFQCYAIVKREGNSYLLVIPLLMSVVGKRKWRNIDVRDVIIDSIVTNF